MRRGHPGIGGWRSDNPRHFRSRGSRPPRFRPPRNYPLLENPRFPPPGSRLHPRGPPPFITHAGHPEDHHDRHNYRDDHHHGNQRMPGRGHTRPSPLFPYLQQHCQNVRQKDDVQGNLYQDTFYEDVQVETCRINSMGDVDHRQTPHLPPSRDSFMEHRISPWANPPHDRKKHYYEDRSPHKSFRHDSADSSRVPALDYTGHRPPASDHYGGTSGPTTNNNDTSFSRSVDDTVDIIRKRLMNRNEPQSSQDAAVHQSSDEQEAQGSVNQLIPPEQPAKKKVPRLRPNVKSNCHKMKTNIVHQLFKMDKDKMHKLMDDPGSSSKFEYAISSLITESQNSLNRQLRSVAEKSLYSSSTDFIHNDNNTIYEDTFMKQMQCLLDPQDTVLLEDIKPIVMAELSKVLQLDDDFEQRYELPDEQSTLARDDQSNYSYFEPFNYHEYPQEGGFDQDQITSSNYENSTQSRNSMQTDVSPEINTNYNYEHESSYKDSKPLFQRRPVKQTDHSEEKRQSIENRRQRMSVDKPAEEMFRSKQEPLPLFDSNADQLSEEDDPFAELDKQYHVAVDPNFIGIDDLSARVSPTNIQPADSQNETLNNNFNNEIVSRLETIAKSPLMFPVSSSTESLREIAVKIKREVTQSLDFPKENSTPVNSGNVVQQVEQSNIKQEYAPRTNDSNNDTEKSSSSSMIKNYSSTSRKRSIDQRPSHRKEKRKKSESSHYESSRHTNAVSTRHSDKCNDAPKPYFNIFTPKDERHKESSRYSKKNDTADRNYSDKYVKRKESSKRSNERERESRRKRHSSSSSQSMISPKDSINLSNQTPTKLDPKIKLKPIDMFVDKPKKVSVHHQAHRNTASADTPTKPTIDENKSAQTKTKPDSTAQTIKTVETQVIKKLITKETQTFESKSVSTRFCQTERKRLIAKFVQTDPVSLDSLHKPKAKATDAFERMKEIDMEIQALLQEKFKLYSSLESRDSCPSSIGTLGMTVLNVTPVEEIKDEDDNDSLPDNIMTADAIVDDFTNIPVEELEQIALETVQNDSSESSRIEKKSLRQKVLQQERKGSLSPTLSNASSKRSTKKAKPPNISLIEQIITDDRPLEDIISLDDFEEPPAKSKKKSQKPRPKKKSTKKAKPTNTISNDVSVCDIKECSVVLIRTDVRKFIKDPSPQSEDSKEARETSVPSSIKEETPIQQSEQFAAKTSQEEEEAVVNDLQFDMLDVSEDIVIGDNCEIKCSEDKEERVIISEEVILDNSQSSADEGLSTETGQLENECRMYDYSTDEKLRRDSVTVTGNADAVLAIECIENDFIAACLDGNVYHFSGDGQLLNTLRGSNLAVTCLTIVKEKYGTTVYTGSLDSRIRYYDLDTGLEKGPECNVLSPIQTMDRAWDTVFVGTRTGFVLQFECKNNMLIPVSTVKFSEQSILALRAMKEGPRKVLLVAARSENVTIKDAQTGLLLRTLSGPKMTVYTLLFEDGKVFCGTSSHQIHVFDYASGMHTGCHEGGKGAVCLRATGGLLFAGCYDGCVYVYREGDTRPLAQLRGPSLMLLSLAVVGSKIIAGYKDRSLYIWKIPLSILQEMIL